MPTDKYNLTTTKEMCPCKKERLLQNHNPSKYREQATLECPSLNDMPTTQLLYLMIRDHYGRGSGKIVRDRRSGRLL